MKNRILLLTMWCLFTLPLFGSKVIQAEGPGAPHTAEVNETGTITLETDFTVQLITDGGSYAWTQLPDAASIPDYAYVTKVEVQVRVSYLITAADFRCSDYEIWISNFQSDPNGESYCLWNNYGGATDQGFDSDAADDADIYFDYTELAGTPFYGHAVYQPWIVLFKDNVAGHTGGIDYVRLRISYATNKPNLSVQDTPPGWSSSIVVSNAYNTHVSDEDLEMGNVYLDFAVNVENNNINEDVVFEVFLDGHSIFFEIEEGLPTGFYTQSDIYLPDLSHGTHELRLVSDSYLLVDETDEEDNKKTLYFYCNYPEPPVPELSSPEDGSSCLSAPVEFSWSTTGNSFDHYKFQYSDDRLFTRVMFETLIDASATGHYTTVNLPRNATLYWRVKGYNADREGSWSEVRRFSVQRNGSVGETSLTEPLADASCISSGSTFSWEKADNADISRIQIDDNEDFSSPIFEDTEYGESIEIVDLPGTGPYYWRIRGETYCEKTGPWSTVRSFTVAPSEFSAAVLQYPKSISSCVDSEIEFQWQAVENAVEYTLQVDESGSFTPGNLKINEVLTGTSFTAEDFERGTTYYWRVISENACGGSSTSGTETFTTLSLPDSPAITNMTSGASCVSLTPVFEWEPIADIYSYQVDICKESIGYHYYYSTFQTSYQVPELEPDTEYSCRISASSECDYMGPASDKVFFTTKSVIPDAPVITSPEEGASCFAFIDQNIVWNAIDAAQTYEVELSTDPDFEDDVTSNVVSDPVISPHDLISGANYFARVKGVNSCHEAGAWSEPVSFTTIMEAPDRPQLLFPEDGVDCAPLNANLIWHNQPKAESYLVEVDSESTFSDPDFQITTADTFALVQNLELETSYFWRVSAINTCDVESEVSSINSFTTIEENLPIPLLAFPENESTAQDTNLILRWNSIDQAEFYHVLLSADISFDHVLIQNNEVADTFLAVDMLEHSTSYFWKVSALGNCASGEWSSAYSFGTVEDEVLPNALTEITSGEGLWVGQNYPNPFLDYTLLPFSTTFPGKVSIELLDINGRVMLCHEVFYDAGKHQFKLETYKNLDPGIYFYRIRAGNQVEIRHCIKY